MSKTALVDLSTAKITITETSPDLLRQFLGGRGVGAKLLYDNVGPEVKPLSPENYLIFTAAPMAGTPWPASARLHVTFKSPATGAYGYANSGGFFVAELRHAGYDALLITGQASAPVILRIVDQRISIEAAGDLWGKPTSQVHDAILGPDPKPAAGRVACIGPAGENQVTIAAIINDHNRAAARAGAGAVMGSKNLKAIHVKATERPKTPSNFRSAARDTSKKLNADPRLDGLRKYGTLMLMDSKNAGGDQPAKNHQLVQVPFIEKVNAKAFDGYLLQHKGCYACPIKCSRKSEVADGDYAVKIGGPEYETTNALGPMCWLDDPEAIIYANHLCNEYGLDTISAGVTIAFAMELREKGLLADPDLSLEWGDADTVIGLLKKIAWRQGIGDTLAQGTRRAAAIIGQGAERYAMQVKGLELPRQEPRFAKGFGLGHATGNRGADHLYALPAIDLAANWDAARRIFPAEIVPELMDPANEKYKPDMVVYGEHFCAITDALGICKFSTVEEYSLFPEDLAPGVAALRDEALTGQDLLTIGERIVNLERLYNVREGLSRADDQLPRRFTEERAPLYEFETDPDTGEVNRSEEPIRYGLIEDFDAMLNRYYDLRGWSRDGVPTEETLRRLGLKE
ncbi:MAG TPA: aldehyde ferredoxin oxidoreductase family protein [Chloroflexi bacterium]|nr:aldehyde ferredoxin oxidoreductase family protein [Chloroflexota bacterium]